MAMVHFSDNNKVLFMKLFPSLPLAMFRQSFQYDRMGNM